jgi:DNA-directed RNA polymerase sigma subunit (sigma70/sigma32)
MARLNLNDDNDYATAYHEGISWLMSFKKESWPEVFRGLSERQLFVVLWRYGMAGKRSHATLQELAHRLLISEVEVRRIEKDALAFIGAWHHGDKGEV